MALLGSKSDSLCKPGPRNRAAPAWPGQ